MSSLNQGRGKLHWKFEFKPQDMWVGLFWKTEAPVAPNFYKFRKRVDVWICLIPCVPLHIWFYSFAPMRAKL